MADAEPSRVALEGDELAQRINASPDPTADDQTTMLDGQVLDSPDSVLRYFADLERNGETGTTSEWTEALTRFEAGEPLTPAGD